MAVRLEAFHGEFAVDLGYDDLAGAGAFGSMDDQEVPVPDARIAVRLVHRVAINANISDGVGPAAQIFIDIDPFDFWIDIAAAAGGDWDCE